MRRFLTLVCLLCLSIPAEISISGCTRNPGENYCNGLGFGMKVTDLAVINFPPATTGISIAYGQTRLAGIPSAVTCKGESASVSRYSYGTTNNQLVDISPTGNICAGTWNRNLGGGIPDYTICSPPNPLPSTGGLPYATAFITASADSVVSNPVEIFVHPQVTSVSLVTSPLSGSAKQCYSQSTQATLDAQACYSTTVQGQPTNVLLCAPASVTSSANPTLACPLPTINGQQVPLSSIPNCTASIGSLAYSVGTPTIASIVTNTTTNQVTITAQQPGTTEITASVALSGSSAGYFSTCPPERISVTLPDGSTAGTITKGVTQNLITTVTDTLGNPITGLTLDYQSTDPIDISVQPSGAITTSFPGVASVYAICQPSTCNPSPINEIGLFGTGLPISSNSVTVTTPGTASDYLWISAPGQSQYVVPVELLTGTVGSTTRLPYVPNSMVMDRMGNNLYFGSDRELMIFSTSTSSLSKVDPNVQGVVLAVSPNNSTLLINDQNLKRFYIYTAYNGSFTTFSGLGNAAAWTPDSKTLYITDSASLGAGHSNTLYVYNANTSWTSCTAGQPCAVDFSGAKSLALTIPSVGAYFGGNTTVSRTWCPTGIVGGNLTFYPQGDVVTDASQNPVQTDELAATTDGKHILGALFNSNSGVVTLSDIGVSIPTTECAVTTNPSTGVQTLSALSTTPVLDATLTLDPTRMNATALHQIVPSPQSNLAFITYSAADGNTNATLPYYIPGAAGAVGYLPLTTQSGGTAPSAPVAGAFAPDDTIFFVSTAGDNMIHYISIPAIVSPATPLVDKQQISPNLPACSPGTDAGCQFTGSGTTVPATVITVIPRSTT